MADTEKMMMRRLRRGETSALAQVYERYKDELLTVATYITGESQAGEDVLHDVFVRFAADVRGLGELRSLRQFLTRCVANRAKDHLRHLGVSPKVVDPEGLSNAATDGKQPPDDVAEVEHKNQVSNAILSLPPEQREVVTLHLHGEMAFSQIAELLGTSINTVQSRYRYALEKLRLLLKAKVQL